MEAVAADRILMKLIDLHLACFPSESAPIGCPVSRKSVKLNKHSVRLPLKELLLRVKSACARYKKLKFENGWHYIIV